MTSSKAKNSSSKKILLKDFQEEESKAKIIKERVKKKKNLESKNIKIEKDENLKLIKEIHAILLNCAGLTSKQKIGYCESERYFMKLYLRGILRRLYNKFRNF
ncbi:MAG: hypothetical protein ACTSUT_01020 [Promethearchaeota archaeon]